MQASVLVIVWVASLGLTVKVSSLIVWNTINVQIHIAPINSTQLYTLYQACVV